MLIFNDILLWRANYKIFYIVTTTWESCGLFNEVQYHCGRNLLQLVKWAPGHENLCHNEKLSNIHYIPTIHTHTLMSDH